MFETPFQTIVQYEGSLEPNGTVGYDFPEQLEIKYMLHCEGGVPVFENGVIVANLQKAELVLFEINGYN